MPGPGFGRWAFVDGEMHVDGDGGEAGSYLSWVVVWPDAHWVSEKAMITGWMGWMGCSGSPAVNLQRPTERPHSSPLGRMRVFTIITHLYSTFSSVCALL